MSALIRYISVMFATCLVGAFPIGSIQCLMAQNWPSTIKVGHVGVESAMVQSLINEVDPKTKLVVDGSFGMGTKAAVSAFQTAAGITSDGIVGPATWAKLFDGTTRYLLTFHVESNSLDVVETPFNESLYECKVTLKLVDTKGIRLVDEYRGSIMPDDKTNHGQIKNGFYLLHLGFHKRTGAKPGLDDLIVKTNGALRPCLVVNQDKDVPVTSGNPTKTTANAIHIHNGFNTERGSEGCLTIRPDGWSGFIERFLSKHSKLYDWSVLVNGSHSYRGKEIGFLLVE